MKVYQRPFDGPLDIDSLFRTRWSDTPIRCVSTPGNYCDIGFLEDEVESDIFEFVYGRDEDAGTFNVCMIVPTGVDAAIGGHAGDATPAARLIGGVCDALITHPNVVNASDLNEMPFNTMYVEGSTLTRLLMGTVGLRKVRSNRVLIVLTSGELANDTINSVNAARATYGLNARVKFAEWSMKTEFTEQGIATGIVEGLENLWAVLEKEDFDAVALSSPIEMSDDLHEAYYKGGVVNPWGGVEALLTHAVSLKFNVPCAHAPMAPSKDWLNIEVGVVNPCMAAEVISNTFLQSVLKGLHRSPKIVRPKEGFSLENVSALVVPDGCIGLPFLAACRHGIPVIVVRENTTLVKNDLTTFPCIFVDNYFEAAGVLVALRSGLSLDSIRRPLESVV